MIESVPEGDGNNGGTLGYGDMRFRCVIFHMCSLEHMFQSRSSAWQKNPGASQIMILVPSLSYVLENPLTIFRD